MHTDNRNPLRPLTLATIVAAVALAAACSRETNEPTVGQKVDRAVTTAEQKTEAAGKAVGDAATRVGDAIADKSKDLAITTAVNAEFARDPGLSALRINVDSSAGQVALRGTAPDVAARDRATTLARGVSGVVSVDNQLKVVPKS